MREYELVIDDALKNGLSVEKSLPPNSPYLSSCLGFRCGKGGLEPHLLMENPLPAAFEIVYSWPFPQVISGDKNKFLIVRDDITDLGDNVYLLSEDNQTLTWIFLVDQLTFGTGTLMELADFGKFAVMMNGVVIIQYDYTSDSWIQVDPSSSVPLMRTICNYKGQAFGGAVTNSWKTLDETFYIWSRIASFDFTPDKDNEAGFKRCPYGGDVYHVRRLDDFIVGYSSKGITYIFPVSEPTVTFGFKESCEVGLLNRGAVSGNRSRHVFVGEDYIIREATKNGVKELGYQHYVEQLEGEDVIVNYDSIKGDFYIGNSSKTFLLSYYGMSEVQQHPSTLWRGRNITYSIPESVDSDTPNFEVDSFDMGYKGQKTSATIEANVLDNTGVTGQVSITNDMKTWETVGPSPMNDKGIVSLTAAGDTFKIKLNFEDGISAGTKIGFVKLRYKMTDLRGIRGVYAPGLRGQSNDK